MVESRDNSYSRLEEDLGSYLIKKLGVSSASWRGDDKIFLQHQGMTLYTQYGYVCKNAATEFDERQKYVRVQKVLKLGLLPAM